MSNVPAHLIEEARKRGIVPGAKVVCAAACDPERQGAHGVVAAVENWFSQDKIEPWIRAGKDNDGDSLYILYRNRWSAVITPAEEGLKYATACRCSPEMKAAIRAEAAALGITFVNGSGDGLGWSGGGLQTADTRSVSWEEMLPDIEFLRRLRLMKPKEPDIEVGGHVVRFKADHSIAVGCTTVDFNTLERVYQRAKAQQK